MSVVDKNCLTTLVSPRLLVGQFLSEVLEFLSLVFLEPCLESLSLAVVGAEPHPVELLTFLLELVVPVLTQLVDARMSCVHAGSLLPESSQLGCPWLLHLVLSCPDVLFLVSGRQERVHLGVCDGYHGTI